LFTSENETFTGAYLITVYACLQVLVNNNAYMAKQLCYHKLQSKHPKSICSRVLSCYFEAEDVKKYMFA